MVNFCHQSGVDELKMGNFGLNFNKELKYLSGILTDLQNRPCFSELVKMESKECYAMIKTDENLNISAESQLICTKPSEQGSFFWISQNESKECYTTIKSDENSNISAEFQQFQQKLKYLSGILTDLHQTFRTGLIFLNQSIWVQGVLCYDQTDENLNISAESWLIWQILPKKWLNLAPNGQFWSFCRFFHLFPQKSGSDWPGMANFTWGVHQQMFSVFQPFKSFRTKAAQNDP